MALFSRKKAAAQPREPKPPYKSTDRPVPESRFREGSLGAIGLKLFNDCGMSYVTFSSQSIGEHFSDVARAAPIFSRSSAYPSGAGSFEGIVPDTAWVAWDSPAGSLIATHLGPGLDASIVLDEIGKKLGHSGPGIEWSIATMGKVPTPVAAILSDGQPVPVWDLPGLAATKPAGGPESSITAELHAQLIAVGWEDVGRGRYKTVVGVEQERTQVVFFSRWNEYIYACMSPVAEAESNGLPEAMRDWPYEDYRLEIVGGYVMVARPLLEDPQELSFETVIPCAVEIAAFADRIERILSPTDTF